MKNVSIKRKGAFSLAEALIILVVIGIVVAVTAPSLIQHYKSKSYKAADEAFMANIKNSMKNMQVADKLMGYSNTMEFVNELKNYLKIIKVCDSEHLSDCFASEIKKGSGENSPRVSLDEYKTSDSFNKEYEDNNVGVILVNGMTAIITYDPTCSVAGMNYQDSNSLSCIDIMYDVNGLKKPNSTAVDIKILSETLNLSSSSGR